MMLRARGQTETSSVNLQLQGICFTGSKLIQKAINFHNNFFHLETDEQFKIFMDDNLVKDTADIFVS